MQKWCNRTNEKMGPVIPEKFIIMKIMKVLDRGGMFQVTFSVRSNSENGMAYLFQLL